jgi:hypothetical protein
VVLGRKEDVSTKIFIIGLIIKQCLSDSTPLVLRFIDYEEAVDSVDRRALLKVLFMCGIPCMKNIHV